MSLAQTPTLAELRLEMARPLNLEAQVQRSSALHGKLDSLLRMAFHEIVGTEQWTPLRIFETFDLTLGQHSYDIPDGVLPGMIEDPFEVIRDSDNAAFLVHRGIDHYSREAYKVDRNGETDLTVNSGMPLRWDIWDGQLQLYPAPDTSIFSQARFLVRSEPREPSADSDRSFIDKDAHVKMALAYYHIGRPEYAVYRNEAMSRLQIVRKQLMPGRTVQKGPARTSRFNQPGTPESSRRVLFNNDGTPTEAYFRAIRGY